MTRSDFDRKALKHAIAEIEDQIAAADTDTLRGIKLLLDQLQDQIQVDLEALSGLIVGKTNDS